MYQIKRIIKNLIISFMYLISLFIPKSNKTIIIGSWHGERYSDNSKALFELLIKEKKYNVYWYTRNKSLYMDLKERGIPVLYKYSIKAIYIHFRAKYHVIDHGLMDILSYTSVRTLRLNLWHGIPLKKIGYYQEENKHIYNDLWSNHYLLVPSSNLIPVFSRAFGISPKQCLVSSYPRNKVFFENKKQDSILFKVYYLPTFREKNTENLFLKNIDIIDQKLMNKDIKIYLKLHYHDANVLENKTYKNLTILDSKSDVYDHVSQVDLLITDYSSIYFDYMLSNRPILFFPFDYEQYLNFERGFIFDYNNYTPGDKVYTVDDLMSKIFFIKQNLDFYQKKYENQYNKIKHELFEYPNNQNYEHLIDFFERGIKK